MGKMDSDLCWGIILIAVILFIVGSILILFPSSKDFFCRAGSYYDRFRRSISSAG